MNRLQAEVQRLYAPPAPGGAGPDSDESGPVDAQGRVRAMVLALAGPADWPALSKVWTGVQAELDLPAPAIAIDGQDAYQLWFSLAEPVAAARAQAFLEALRRHYLGEVRVQRVALWPTPGAAAWPQTWPARRVPVALAQGTRWSAFVAPDLAPLFADEPWLDLPPGADGQSSLLSRLRSIASADFERVLAQLAPAAMAPAAVPAAVPEGRSAAADDASPPRATASATATAPAGDPKRFLLEVMNDDAVDLALRIEAAKALLPFVDGARGQ